MFVPDVNVLLYATDRSSTHHSRCSKWLAGALSGSMPVGFTWQVLLAFVRLATKPPVFARPLTVDQAFDTVDDWLSRPASVVVHPTDRTSQLMRGLLKPRGTAGNLTTDAFLAAVALSHGATLVSCDRDFEAFPGLRVLNPVDPKR